MSHYDSFRDYAYDVSMDNTELRCEIKRLISERNEEKRLRLIAQMDKHYMAEKLRDAGLSTAPVQVDEGQYECGDVTCCTALERDYHFCPGCGKWIDWREMQS
jgi:hypothetical protein